MSKKEYGILRITAELNEMVNNHLRLQYEVRSVQGQLTKIEANILKSVGFVYPMTILENFTNRDFWNNRYDSDPQKPPTNFRSWDRFNEFENAYRVRNCFMHRIGFLDPNKIADNDIITYKQSNPGDTEWYSIDTDNGRNFVLLDLDWHQKTNRLFNAYINFVNTRGFWNLQMP